MLPKQSVLILGIVAAKPINPYEIVRFLNYMKLEKWFSVSRSSVYATIKNLEAKGLIQGRAVKESKMPEKTVYSLTPEGHREMVDALEAYLGNTVLDYVAFTIATIFICNVPRPRAQAALHFRKKELEKMVERQQAQLGEFPSSQPLGILAASNILNITKAELSSTEQLQAKVDGMDEWNNFLTLDIEC